MIWILGNGKDISFWYDNWMEESPLIHKVQQYMLHHIQDTAKVCDFITLAKPGTRNLLHILPADIVNKINSIPVPISDVP